MLKLIFIPTIIGLLYISCITKTSNNDRLVVLDNIELVDVESTFYNTDSLSVVLRDSGLIGWYYIISEIDPKPNHTIELLIEDQIKVHVEERLMYFYNGNRSVGIVDDHFDEARMEYQQIRTNSGKKYLIGCEWKNRIMDVEKFVYSLMAKVNNKDTSLGVEIILRDQNLTHLVKD